MDKLLTGGFLAGKKTYILSGTGIISAVAGYLVGDLDIITTLQSVFTLGGIFFLRAGMK